MRFVNLPHMRDPINVDTIIDVRWDAGGWKYDSWDGPSEPWKVVVRGFWWNRHLWRYHGGFWYAKPRITLRLLGDDQRYLEVRPGEVERFASDIIKALRDLGSGCAYAQD